MGPFLITNVRIFDGEVVVSKNISVLISSGKIKQISSTPVKDFNGTIISRPGHTLLPGFIDAHVHIDFGNESGLAQGLRFGVTTQCDLGNAPFQIQKLREMVSKGDCSDLKSAMKSATPDGGWPAPLLKVNSFSSRCFNGMLIAVTQKKGVVLPPDDNPLETAEQGQEYVDEQIRTGADYIKILHESGASFGMKLPTLPSCVEQAIVDKAHSSGRIVLAHAFSHDDALEVLALGVDGTAHATVDQPPTDDLVHAYKKHNAFCNPTLTVIGSSTAEGRRMQRRYANDPRVQDLLVEAGRESMCECLAMTSKRDGSLRNAIETVKKLKEEGIDIVW